MVIILVEELKKEKNVRTGKRGTVADADAPQLMRMLRGATASTAEDTPPVPPPSEITLALPHVFFPNFSGFPTWGQEKEEEERDGSKNKREASFL